MNRPIAILCLALGAAACGSDGDGDGDGGARLVATGPVAFTATEFVSLTRAEACEVEGIGFGLALALIGASDRAGICADLQAQQDRQNQRAIVLALASGSIGGTAAVATGAYPVLAASVPSGTRAAVVGVSQDDATCESANAETATGGTVTVTSVAGGRIQGTVDATLAGGGTVTGSFDAPSCPVAIPGDAAAFCLGDFDVPPTSACVP